MNYLMVVSCMWRWQFQYKMFIFWPMTIYLLHMHTLLIRVNILHWNCTKTKQNPQWPFFRSRNFLILPKCVLFFQMKNVDNILDSNKILPKIFAHVFIQEYWWRSYLYFWSCSRHPEKWSPFSGHLRPFYNTCPCFYVIILQY